MDSSNLFAIQSLNGQYPGDKYKELHSIASQIAENEEERNEFVKTVQSDRVHPSLLPRLRILVGIKLKINEFVIESLKSDDITIIKQALNAKWFFNIDNSLIQVDYFVKNILPYISLRTRIELIKTLAHCLMSDSNKANEFFGSFADLYGLEQSLPLIVACSENYIFDAIIKRRIVLPSRILIPLYRRYPKLVIRYLQLGNEKNEENVKERTMHTISFKNYLSFLPILIKNHTQIFIELYESLPYCYQKAKLGGTRAEFFLKNATDVLIRKPHIYLNILPLKLVSSKLTTQQFETMFGNLYPKNEAEFSINSMLYYLQYYPEEKKFYLIANNYKNFYGKDFLKYISKRHFDSYFYKFLPADMKEEFGRKLLQSHEGTSAYNNYLQYLPPKQSIPILKEKIKSPSETSRSFWIQTMIDSCAYYDNKDDLLDVLNYYNTRHKNEQAIVFQEVLLTITSKFRIETLDKAHWRILMDIILRSYIKGDLFSSGPHVYVPLFAGALRYLLKQCKSNTVEDENSIFLDKLINIILDCYMEHNMKWEFILDGTDIEKDCMQKFLSAIPQKYPENHKAWNKFENKLEITSYLINFMNKFNTRNFYIKPKTKQYNNAAFNSKSAATKQARLAIKDYAWLMKFASDILKNIKAIIKNKKNLKKSLQNFRESLREHDSEFYQSIIDEDPFLINSIITSDALNVLKIDHEKILTKWKLYLNECRELLQHGATKSAKHFISVVKWYQEIPIRFAELCLHEIEVKGSVLVLGILLDGKSFCKIIEPYLPKQQKLDIEDENAKKAYEITSSLPKAINFTNPPVSFDIIATFCQGDFVSLAAQTLTSVGRRVPIDKVLEFANQLVNRPISVKKLGIRLVFQVAPKSEIREFLIRLWKTEENASIREVLGQMIFKVFKQLPSAETWDLMKTCIDELTSNDYNIWNTLNNLDGIDVNYVARYIEAFIMKLDNVNGNDFNENLKTELFRNITSTIDKKIMRVLPEEILTYIFKRLYLIYSMNFILNTCMFSEPKMFEARLNKLIDCLKDDLENFDKPHPKKSEFRPAKKRFRYFLTDVVSCMTNFEFKRSENRSMMLRLCDETFKLFTSNLQPWQEQHSFITLFLLIEFLKSETLREFGRKCVTGGGNLIKTFTSETVISDIADVINTLIRNFEDDQGSSEDTILNVIEGMIESKDRIGALIAIKMLNCYEVRASKYEKFLDACREIKDTAVQAGLNALLNELNDNRD